MVSAIETLRASVKFRVIVIEYGWKSLISQDASRVEAF